MVEAWFMDDSDVDQRQPHKTDPPRFISPEDLLVSTGVESFKVSKVVYLNILQYFILTFDIYILDNNWWDTVGPIPGKNSKG